ncbi:dihydrofolate reductase [Vaginella massiliensis]|uniref:dihydrofolate reductase n=1 Tax=Vaginella massiliensis TaxID=1816680 RepID=UPI00083864EF|nr:dihydrofolate reductase [Vaginella massiliensis]
MISIVVAVSSNHVIGKNNQLLWHLPDDFKHFKNITTGHPIIMGRKTYESIGRPLPNRINIVVTRDQQFCADGIVVAFSLKAALEKALALDDEVFVIGGGELYRQVIDMADKIYLTEIHHEFDGDTFFPELDENNWEEISRAHHDKDEKHQYSFDIITYQRS